MRSCWRLLLVGSGIVLIITGFVYDAVFAGIPYQDPPPKLAARYAFHAAVASALFWSGSAVFLTVMIASVLSVVIRRVRARRA
ncbi:MAG: hypothetical protein NZ701_03800 [Roseiflexus sp.]|nr:hypothetical protein [Roseiflexus sp.]